jgi:hypothetical protein
VARHPDTFRATGLATLRTGHAFTPVVAMTAGVLGQLAFLVMLVVAIMVYLPSRQSRHSERRALP